MVVFRFTARYIVINNMENLKCDKTIYQQVAQLPGDYKPSGGIYSVAFMLVNSGNDNDSVVTRLSWNEQMELKDSEEDLNNSTLDRPGMTKFA